MNNETTLNIQKYALSFGVTAGVGRILLDVITKTLDFPAIAWYSTYFIAFILEVIIIVYAIKKFKATNGFLNLAQSIKIGVIIMLVLGLLYTSFSWLYDTYIDTEFTMRKTLEIVEKFSPDQVEATKEQFEEAEQNKSKSALGILMYTIWFVFLGGVISLISGAAMKTKEV